MLLQIRKVFLILHQNLMNLLMSLSKRKKKSFVRLKSSRGSAYRLTRLVNQRWRSWTGLLPIRSASASIFILAHLFFQVKFLRPHLKISLSFTKKTKQVNDRKNKSSWIQSSLRLSNLSFMKNKIQENNFLKFRSQNFLLFVLKKERNLSVNRNFLVSKLLKSKQI